MVFSTGTKIHNGKNKNNKMNKSKNEKIPLKEWEIYFKNLNQDNDGNDVAMLQSLRRLEEETVFCETDFSISQSEIRQCIRKSKNKKSAGLDKIRIEMVKYSQYVTIPILEKIFNAHVISILKPSLLNKNVSLAKLYDNGRKT